MKTLLAYSVLALFGMTVADMTRADYSHFQMELGGGITSAAMDGETAGSGPNFTLEFGPRWGTGAKLGIDAGLTKVSGLELPTGYRGFTRDADLDIIYAAFGAEIPLGNTWEAGLSVGGFGVSSNDVDGSGGGIRADMMIIANFSQSVGIQFGPVFNVGSLDGAELVTVSINAAVRLRF